jgi:hypothetical protein
MHTEVADALPVALITGWMMDMLAVESATDTPIIGLPRWKESLLHISAVDGLLDVDGVGA